MLSVGSILLMASLANSTAQIEFPRISTSSSDPDGKYSRFSNFLINWGE